MNRFYSQKLGPLDPAAASGTIAAFTRAIPFTSQG
jgi:hypothetical protein